jgi:pyruvate-ferredoxin/flavodoxin oxidoreductase
LGADARRSAATRLLAELGNRIGPLGAELLGATQTNEEEVAAQRLRVSELKSRLESDAGAGPLLALVDNLVRTTVWIVGGDGWAYDIGFGGVDHVLASGQDVNILVLDTEVYSNTGGQASKATPRGAVAKFSSGGKATAKKDLGMIAMAYGNVYVAQIAMGANMTQTVKALAEADAHPGPSLVIAYSPCIAHGIDMATQMTHQREAADSGYWPLYRYDPAAEAVGTAALKLDSRPPSIPFKTFAEKEARFSMLELTAPDHARTLLDAAQRDIDDRWHLYEQMVNVHRTATFEEHE